MLLDPLQERYLERFFPGLIAAVEALGPGKSDQERPRPSPRGAGICGIFLRLTYTLDDGHRVEIRIDLQLKRGLPTYLLPPKLEPVILDQWERVYYRLHYGVYQGETIFRFDMSAGEGHHVHIKAHYKDHLASKDAEPDVRNLDPRTFIEMVAKFRVDGEHPVRKKDS